MNVNDLRERLDDLEAQGEIDGDTKVLFAHQPNYPLQSGVSGATTAGLIWDYDENEDDLPPEAAPEGEMTVAEEREHQTDRMTGGNGNALYLVEGGQIHEAPYGPGAAWDAAEVM